ncbi:unnamed protein product [Rotaria socialis]|uniref:Uncharacterized protein n=1 Tax=Rotaria socialis TaxID=392032 RepID=A0A818PQT3_9BILA|nr:unnamed protein product [Rotaria socialis]CAF3247896.1 unnamed protein product [Rotaria socialis]CAF3627777.1 unnamed protein product [Rotaria socialis]CAF4199595.1 unnamed protein product [Rotaria socialis]CAF4227657.1 unnamed protein product [Rotaria socialis]
MHNRTTVTNLRELSMTYNKSRTSSSIGFKRKSSGHVPLLSTSSRPMSNMTNLAQSSDINNTSKRKVDEYENDSFKYDVPTTNYASVRKQQQTQSSSSTKRVKSTQSFVTKAKLLPEDGSLRLVTSTVQGMKHWTNKHLPYPILFEVFGKLDSQVTSLSLTNTRQFSLIDEKDRIECIFAEMDQSFSNIDRDVQLRIICRLEPKSSLARCIAIRIANKDEWNEKYSIIKQCDLQLNEDDLNSKKLKKNNKKLQK